MDDVFNVLKHFIIFICGQNRAFQDKSYFQFTHSEQLYHNRSQLLQTDPLDAAHLVHREVHRSGRSVWLIVGHGRRWTVDNTCNGRRPMQSEGTYLWNFVLNSRVWTQSKAVNGIYFRGCCIGNLGDDTARPKRLKPEAQRAEVRWGFLERCWQDPSLPTMVWGSTVSSLSGVPAEINTNCPVQWSNLKI